MKDAFGRSLRTFAQTLAGALVALPTASSVVDIRNVGEPLLVALYVAFMAGLVSFLMNLGENATGTPKA